MRNFLKICFKAKTIGKEHLSFWKSTEIVRWMCPYHHLSPQGVEQVGPGMSNPISVTQTASTVLEELLRAELCLAPGCRSPVLHWGCSYREAWEWAQSSRFWDWADTLNTLRLLGKKTQRGFLLVFHSLIVRKVINLSLFSSPLWTGLSLWKDLLMFHFSSEIYHVSPSCDSDYFNILFLYLVFLYSCL